MSARIVWCEFEDGNFQHETLADLLDYDGDIQVGQTVWFGECVEPGTNWIDVEDVIEMISMRAYDVGGEHAEEFPEVSNEAKTEIADFLRKWQAKHCKPDFWIVRNVKTHTVTAEDSQP